MKNKHARPIQSQVDILFQRLRQELCPAAAQAAIKAVIDELGGLRITIPSYEDFWRRERDNRIRKAFNGRNISELKERFNLSGKHIRRILTEPGQASA